MGAWMPCKTCASLFYAAPAVHAVPQAATEVRADDAARLSELAAQLSKESAELAKLRASCAGLQKRASGLQDKIDNAGGEPLRRARERVASLQVCVCVAMLLVLFT
jgi:hypothetical protein